MDYVKLPDLRHVVRGFNLRMSAARAISSLETAAMNGADVTPAAQELSNFFTACATAAQAAVTAGGSAPKPKSGK